MGGRTWSRRSFVRGSLATAALAPLAGTLLTACAPPPLPPGLPAGLFTLGVASGDPLPDAVMLWTRLAPAPLAGGGMPAVDVPVRWQVAEDESFARIAHEGTTVASPAFGHSVHVDATGLRPGAWYYYRFLVGDEASPVGRTRTLPAGEARVVTLGQAYPDPIEDVWDACTNPERIPRWFMPISGDLQVGGHYQLEGNAGGTVERCDPPKSFAVTWEFGGEVSWVEVRLSPTPEGGTYFQLEHIAHVDDERWGEFGPGAVGVGWDLGLLGLATHLATGAAVAPDEGAQFAASEDGRMAVFRDARSVTIPNAAHWFNPETSSVGDATFYQSTSWVRPTMVARFQPESYSIIGVTTWTFRVNRPQSASVTSSSRSP